VDITATATRRAGHCDFQGDSPENPVKNTPKSFGPGQSKLHKSINDALAHLRFRSLTKRAKALPIDDLRREAFFARSKDQFSTKILNGCPDNDIMMTMN
jgi:hypothetical protein